MTDFAKSWQLSRGRLKAEVEGMNQAQLNYRIHPNSLSAGQAVVHVVGVEIWFVAQLTGAELPGELGRVAKCATEGVVNDNTFPFSDDELTPEFIQWALETGETLVKPHIETPSEVFLTSELKSALGPMISGEGALTRFAFHPAYHQGQIYLCKTAPDFPS